MVNFEPVQGRVPDVPEEFLHNQDIKVLYLYCQLVKLGWTADDILKIAKEGNSIILGKLKKIEMQDFVLNAQTSIFIQNPYNGWLNFVILFWECYSQI